MSYLALFKSLPKRAYDRYRNLPFYGKLLLWLWILFEICLVIALVVITPSRVAQFLYNYAEKLAQSRFGWFIIGCLIACVSFPPLPGHTTLTTLCGYAWGVPYGFYIAAPASVLGSALVFTVLRLGFQKRLQHFYKGNEKWQALEAVIAAKGLPLIILIRMSALPPWTYSNAFFASIGSVGLWQFIIATFFVFPKIFLQVYIGSRLAALSDGEQRGAMDTRTKIINGFLIGGGIIIAVFASGLVFKLVQKQIRTLSGIPPEIDELAAEAIEDSEEAPLLTSNTPV